jgi:hypothetical protein
VVTDDAGKRPTFLGTISSRRVRVVVK